VISARLRRALPKGEAIRLAVVHAFSTHDLLLRRFIESGGIDLVEDVQFSVVPPPEMPEALAAGRIDGFCAGAPWSAVAAQMGVGRTVALTSAIWPNHPEKCFAVRADWAEANRSALDGLLRALRPAGLACDDAANTPALAELLAGPDWVGVPAPLIAASLPGGSGAESDRSIFAAHHAMIPDPGAGRWFLEQIALRWPVPEKADTVVRINGARQWR
jgi:ABC-type nitrate/sulfonate/bicarbonate transport system substrate-binding protein